MVRRGLILVVALLAFPASARASTATVESGGVLHVVSAPGVLDWLDLRPTDGGAVSLSDERGVRVTAGAGCTQAGLAAECPGVVRAVVETGDGDDHVYVSSLGIPMRIDGGTGDDVLAEGSGADQLDGGEGDDVLIANDGSQLAADSFTGGPGHDRVDYELRSAPVSVSLDGVADDGQAGEGDNVATDVEDLDGGRGNDVLTGGPGDDQLNGREGADVLYGLGGDDTLDGWQGCGRDQLYGGADDDRLLLEGGTYADGGPGDDTLALGGSDCDVGDTAIGGPGVDLADFSREGATDVQVSLDDVADDGHSTTDDYRSDIENVRAGPGGMVLIGSAGPNVLTGGAGDDVLVGEGGADVLAGGGGYDVADYSDHGAAVDLSLDGQANDGAAGEGDRIATDVEDLRGGAGSDRLTGDAGDNVLDGGPGGDTLLGGAGLDAVDYSDRTGAVRVDLDGSAGDGEAGEGDTVGADVEGVFGGAGNDVLTGNAADGFLSGDEGDDQLTDRGGKDLLDGGGGADRIDSDDGAADADTCGDGADTVIRDTSDTADSSCELVTTSGGPVPAPRPASTRPLPVPRPPSAPRAPLVRPDRSAPKATVTAPTRVRLATLRRRGLALVVTCNEACVASAELTNYRGVLARARGTGPLRLRVTRLGRRKLRRGTYRFVVTVTDPAGNERHLSRSLRLT